MQRFTDANGNEWQLSVNGRTLKEVREKTGILLTSIFDESMQLLVELHRDPILLADVLWVLIEEQAAAKNITVRDFAESFGGDMVSASRTALIEATIDFFDDQEKRQGARELLRKMLTIEQNMRTSGRTMINDLDTDSAAKSIMDSFSSSPVFAE